DGRWGVLRTDRPPASIDEWRADVPRHDVRGGVGRRGSRGGRGRVPVERRSEGFRPNRRQAGGGSDLMDSAKLFKAASRVIPGGVNSPVRAFRGVGGEPFFVASAEGARITDVDGRR